MDDQAATPEMILKTGKPGETHIVGVQNERTNLQVLQTIYDILDHLLPLPQGRARRELTNFVTDRPGHDQRYSMKTFESGVKKTVRWCLDRSDLWRPLNAHYSQRRLGLSPAKAVAT